MNRNEITWSLMHPTPLDVHYMQKIVRRAAEYHVDSFEICADCHTAAGGMDGLIDYASYPETHRKVDLKALAERRSTLREILQLAHSIGKPVYYWHREAVVPDGLLDDLPHLLDSNGEFDLLGRDYEELLRNKIASTFEAVPELDGLVLTLTEASYSVIHSADTAKYPPRQVVEHLVEIFAGELEKRGKRFILRSFGSIASDYEDIIAGAAPVAAKYGFEIETKITPYDFDPFLPINPFLRKLPYARLGAECDCLGEFLGAGMLPAENVENIVAYVASGRAAGVDRYAIRLDRIGNRIFDCYEINLYAYERAISDPEATPEQIRREWLDKHAPPSAFECFYQLGIDGLEVVKKTNFIDGNVIFHQFPSQPTLKYLKAGFIFALFKNGVDLHNGSGVWSILSCNRTPGRDAIIQEKRNAVAMAERDFARLTALEPEPDFQAEYDWRIRLWRNAVTASRAFFALTRVICAYFDDMEADDAAAPRLHAAASEAKRELQASASADLSAFTLTGDTFVNGLEHDLFHMEHSVLDVYLKPFYAIIGLAEKEFNIELIMRREFSSGTCDCVLCGAITDEWRISRFMHGGHAAILSGKICRYAGNTVFPNGHLDMKLRRPAGGGVLVVYGDISVTRDFTIEVDGQNRVCRFDNTGRVVLPLPSGADTVALRLAKAGKAFPAFFACATRTAL